MTTLEAMWPAVLVAALGGTLTKELESESDIYIVDARGHGYTDPPTTDAAAETGVEDLVGFLRAMKIEKPILMGHSMGAATVMRLGATYPDVPRAVIMLDRRKQTPKWDLLDCKYRAVSKQIYHGSYMSGGGRGPGLRGGMNTTCTTIKDSRP